MNTGNEQNNQILLMVEQEKTKQEQLKLQQEQERSKQEQEKTTQETMRTAQALAKATETVSQASEDSAKEGARQVGLIGTEALKQFGELTLAEGRSSQESSGANPGNPNGTGEFIKDLVENLKEKIFAIITGKEQGSDAPDRVGQILEFLKNIKDKAFELAG